MPPPVLLVLLVAATASAAALDEPVARVALEAEIDALTKRGEGLMWEGQRPQALALLEQSLAKARSLGDIVRQARALRYVGGTWGFLGELARSEEALALSRELARRAKEAAEEARTWEMAAHLAWWRGDLKRAREMCDAGLGVAADLDDQRPRATLLLLLGKVHAKADALEEARRATRRAREVFHACGSRAGEAMALQALGQYSLYGFEHATARAHFAGALALWEAVGDLYRQADTVSDLGECFAAEAQLVDAVASFDRALEIAGKLGQETERLSARAKNLHRRALALARLGRFDEARRGLEEAAAIRERMGDREREGVNLFALADVLSRSGADEAALAAYDKALGLLEAVSARRRVSEILLNRGALLLRRGAAERASDDFDRAVIEARQSDQTVALAGALHRRGQVERLRGLKQEALVTFRESLETIERIRPEITAEDQARVEFLDARQSVYEEAAELCVELGRGEEALEIAEKSRARAFLDLLGRRSRGGLSQSVPALGIEQLRDEARRRGAVLVEYFSLPRGLAAWVVDAGGSLRWRQIEVGRAEIERRIGELRDGFSRGRETFDPRPLLRWLHEKLIAPIEEWLPRDADRPVVIVPHGPLFEVPFACLIDGEGRYGVERWTLSTVPALSVLGRTPQRWTTAPARGQAGVLVLGNPAMPSVPWDGTRLGPLPGAEAEARAVAAVLGSGEAVLLLGASAREADFASQARGRRWIHIASHAVLDAAPEKSFIALAPVEGALEDGDGLLTVGEILCLDLSANLVVLSACNTARGKVTGDGVLGLTRSFIAAGAASVVVSLWGVSDLVASRQMTALYRALKVGEGKAAALRQAQLSTLEALRRGDLKGPDGRALPENPLLWGAFVLVGEP